MRKLWVFVLGVFVGGGAVWFGFNYHILNTNEGLLVVRKKHPGLVDLFVNIRNWKPSDWQAHPELVHSLVARGRSDLIAAPATDFLRELQRKHESAEKERDEFRME